MPAVMSQTVKRDPAAVAAMRAICNLPTQEGDFLVDQFFMLRASLSNGELSEAEYDTAMWALQGAALLARYES